MLNVVNHRVGQLVETGSPQRHIEYVLLMFMCIPVPGNEVVQVTLPVIVQSSRVLDCLLAAT